MQSHDSQSVLEHNPAGKLKWMLTAALFALCIGPTFISYQPYLYQWDDAEYLQRSIALSQAFWGGNFKGILSAMVSIRPPAMTLLGIPWGLLNSWDAAGKCFFTLAAVISFLAAFCLYLLLRSGVKPLFVIFASLCVFASMGPYPSPGASAHVDATAFLADSLFAWTTLAALLLIPLEARTHFASPRGAVWRGVLWAAILSLGLMTKLNFLYFIALILPVLYFLRVRRCGSRNANDALIIFFLCSAPSVFYLLMCGKPSFENLIISSLGGVANYYYIPLPQYLGDTIRESPGMLLSFVLTAAALIYLAIKRRLTQSWPDFLALLMVIGFGIIVFAATNRQIRYAFPAIVALPFMTGLLISGKGEPAPRRSAALATAVVFFGLLAASVPVLHRADRQCLSRCDAVLLQAIRCHAKHILFATDSPTMNRSLMDLDMRFSATKATVGTLAYQAMFNQPIAEDLRKIDEADMVVFQDGKELYPPFTNLRVPEYERYIRQGGSVPIRVWDDVNVYSRSCKP